MAIVYLGIGTNLGNREDNCARALSLLEEAGVHVTKRSGLVETEPWGLAEQPSFLNMALEAETGLSPLELLSALKRIEASMGRTDPGERWGPRVIDLDILLYGDEVIESPELRIPHPSMHKRGFVLGPLSEIAPALRHPVLGRTIVELKDSIS
jgi:2-amino-4-hydroxy-6-hydroxymethyldihydropteridine diphosphokinase